MGCSNDKIGHRPLPLLAAAAIAALSVSLTWALVASSTLMLVTVQVEAFSPTPSTSAAASTRGSSSSWTSCGDDIYGSITTQNNPLRVKGITRTSPLFLVGVAAERAKSASPKSHAKKNKSNGKRKNNNQRKRKYNKRGNKPKGSSNTRSNKKQQKHEQGRKGGKHQATGTASSPSSRQRPYADLTTDELKQLTEYHLSQNIPPGDGAISAGDMSSARMHEFSRLLSSWAKLDFSHSEKKRRRGHYDAYSPRQTGELAAEMAEQCLRELIEEGRAGNVVRAARVITPDAFHLVIGAWLRVGGRKDLVHAGSLLDLMEQWMHFERTEGTAGERGDNNEKKDKRKEKKSFASSSLKCYAAVLDGWCRSKFNGSEVKAEELLERMRKIGGGDDGDDNAIDVRHYNNVMNRMATSRKPNAGSEADRLLRKLIESTEAGRPLLPDRNSFNTVIKAYANAGGRHAASDAERILAAMEDPPSAGLPRSLAGGRISPDKISYTSVLMAYANGGGRGSDAGEKAEELVGRMVDMYKNGDGNAEVKPDTVTYNAVLKVWGKSGHPDAGVRSEAILTKMLELYEAGDVDVCPDDVTFNSVIHNIANSNGANSPRRAMRMLERMKSGLISVEPDIISYNSVLNSFAKSGGPESAKRAEEMLDNLEKSYDSGVWNIRPDVYSYNIVISAWGNCGDADRAVALLDRMTARTNEGKANLKPDVTTYNSVLHAWSQSSDRNAPVKALGLLEIMLRLHEGGDRSANPDVLSFSTVINAFSKSKFPRKARQTRDLLRRMKSLYEDGGLETMRPNVYVYAAVLNACAYTFGRAEEKEEALKIGIETYEELRRSKGIETNHVAYGSFIRVCRRLMSGSNSSRDNHIAQAFRQCCDDGQVGEYVLMQLRPMPELCASLMQEYIVDGDNGNEVSIEDLPSCWTCNVKEGKRRRQTMTAGSRSTGRRK